VFRVFIRARSIKLTLVKETDWYTKENLCGKSVVITNLANGQSITVTVADECPTCRDPSSIDLSHAAFGALTNQDFGEGITDISWHFGN
jgi:hypothetical protein